MSTRQVRRNRVRTFNKFILNPAMLRFAGHKYFYASALRHTGRRSGKEYVTPVVAERAGKEFVIPLPYGRDVDWVLNTKAAGKASITAGGRTFEVTSPEVIDAAAVVGLIPANHRRVNRWAGVKEYLKLTIAES